MKNIKRILAVLMVAALVTAFGFTLVACDKGETPSAYSVSMSDVEVEDCLYNVDTGAIILMRSVKGLKVDFSKTEEGVTVVGTASVADDGDKVPHPVAYCKKTTTENGVATELEYYAGFNIIKSSSTGVLTYSAPHYFNKITVDGVLTEHNITKLANASGEINPLYNQYIGNCGVYDGNAYLDDFILDKGGDVVDTVVYVGKKNYTAEKEYINTVIEMTYSYVDEDEDNSPTVKGTAVVEINAEGQITSIDISENNGHTYNASYTYGIETIITPAVVKSGEWVARTEI